MEKLTSFLVICASIIITHAIFVHSSSSSGDHHHQLTWLPSSSTGCRGSMAECLAAGEADEDELGLGLEFDMDSEINRRILATRRRYISYGALSRNTVPCSRRGASYYNCRAGAQANPYSRGCSAITRCRS